MIDYSKCISDPEDLECLLYIRQAVVESLFPVTIKMENYSFQIDPGGSSDNIVLPIWHYGEVVAEYHSFDEFVFNFQINGKPFIQLISSIVSIE